MEPIIIPEAQSFLLPAGKIGCVLVHGFTGAPKEMRLMGNYLQHQGITCFAPRLSGHGTNVKDLPRMRWSDWLASVEDGVHTLRGICEHVFIAGLSMGGLLSLFAASYLPLKGVIAMSTPYKLKDDWRIKLARPFSLLFPFVEKGQSDTVDEETATDHIEYPAYPTRSIAELNLLLTKTLSRLPNISIPILMINSRSDQTVPVTHQQRYGDRLKGKIFESLNLDKSGHVITEDVERELVFQSTLNFIQKYT